MGRPTAQTKDVSDLLSDLPKGRFHAQHFMLHMLAFTCFGVTVDMLPYAFPGFRRDFHLDDAALGNFATAQQLGMACGTILAASLLDRVGRRGMLMVVSPLAVACCCALLFPWRLPATYPMGHPVYLLLWACQSMVWSLQINSAIVWYTEFLPTRGRGGLIVGTSLGLPIGRFLIVSVGQYYTDDWKPLMMLSLSLHVMLWMLYLRVDESPRFLVVRGDEQGAMEVVKRMYAKNRTLLDSRISLYMDRAEAGDAHPSVGSQSAAYRLRLLFGPDLRDRLAFCLLMLSMLSVTTSLGDTWGPSMYGRLLEPGTSEAKARLPHHMLRIFSTCECMGIILAIWVMDKAGRSGCCYIGFFLQGALLSLMPLGEGSEPILLVLGSLGAACKCYGWNAINTFTLEAFATEVRATAMCVASVFMHISTASALHMSGKMMDSVSPVFAVLHLSVLLFIGGCLSTLMPFETANKALADNCCREVRTPLKARRAWETAAEKLRRLGRNSISS